VRTEIRVGGEIRSHQFTDKQQAKVLIVKAQLKLWRTRLQY